LWRTPINALSLDNEALYDICFRILEARQPDYGDLNMLIANALPEPRAFFVSAQVISAS
jgi:hypothetical protein